ncbi:hypothetical protein ACQ4LE_002092 [Meloidogyne hapla]|uniref:J domain-containing protein n=1 Tax=Meloidogyne hapla TaxID=6305 RepID=A0A1I8BMH7_MELHA
MSSLINFDPYKILELQPGCVNLIQINKAYKKMALKWHPDKNLNQKEYAHQMFLKVKQAFEYLKVNKREDLVKKRRAEYNEKMKQKRAAAAAHYYQRNKLNQEYSKLYEEFNKENRKFDNERDEIYKEQQKLFEKIQKIFDKSSFIYRQQTQLSSDFTSAMYTNNLDEMKKALDAHSRWWAEYKTKTNTL